MESRTGSGESTLDDKGRVSIPVRFREQYQGKLKITFGMERCAWVMTLDAWENFEKDFLAKSRDMTPEELFIFQEKYIGQAKDVELDKLGRIAVPSTIRTYAKMDRNCTVICSAGRLSIWDTAMFDNYLTEKDAIARAAMNKLGSDGIFRVG